MSATQNAAAGYDIIGDVHGYANILISLLTKLGYTRRDGVWAHSERIAIFVGDLIDRGSENIQTCRIVMDMTELGSALVTMGNHEFNLLGLTTSDPHDTSGFLRDHTEKNLHQVAKTRAEFLNNPKPAFEILAWMRHLPLWLDLPGLRVCHACWNAAAQKTLSRYVDASGALTEEGFIRAFRKGDIVRRARETVLSGPEYVMSKGVAWRNFDGHECNEIKLAWWRGPGFTWRELAIGSQNVCACLPCSAVPDDIVGYDFDHRPLIFGHYWMREPLKPLSNRYACVDASVAAGGRLAAYRFSGETVIRPENFVYS